MLVSGGARRSVKVWDVPEKKELATLRQDERPEDSPAPLAMAATADGSLVALVSGEKEVIVRDGRTGELRATLKGHDDAVTCIAFNPDGKTLATGSADKPAGDIKIAIAGNQEKGVVGGGNGSAVHSAVCGRIGRERSAEAGEVDVGHGDGDRILSGHVLRQVVEGQHRFLVELPAQRPGNGMQRGFVGTAEMEFARPF